MIINDSTRHTFSKSIASERGAVSSSDRESYVWCPDGHVRSTSATVTVRSVSLHQSLITRWTKNGLLRSRCCCSHHIILWGQSDWIVDADLLWLVVIEWTELTERFVIKKKIVRMRTKTKRSYSFFQHSIANAQLSKQHTWHDIQNVFLSDILFRFL